MALFTLIKGDKKELAAPDQEAKKYLSVVEQLLKGKSKNKYQSKDRAFQNEQSIRDFKNAVNLATQAPWYNRRPLLELYDQLMYDPHLRGGISTRINSTLAEPYTFFDANNEVMPDLTDKLNAPFFRDLIGWLLLYPLYGSVAYEVYKDKGNPFGFFPVPHVNYSPMRHALIPDFYDPSNIKPLQTKEYTVLTAGNNSDLGILSLAARFVLWKQYSLSDWARHSEMFGMPHIVVKTPTTDDNELNNLENSIRKFGRNGYSILGMEDEFQLMKDSGASPHQIYLELCKYCDEQISKAVSGQTSTSDMKAWAGAAAVHERVLDFFVETDMRNVSSHINHVTLPQLAKMKLLPENVRFSWDLFEFRRNNVKEPEQGQEPAELSFKQKPYPFGGGCC